MLHVHETVKDTEEGDCVAHILRSLTKLACSQGNGMNAVRRKKM